ncbi:amidohydrolase [Pseudomonas citronellolis]|uniref:amidohydrolase n=1 Tax=Pseudomonas citronellolis TaxID=53408 RepID=UPI000718473C|nr:amidohydrolase [Pseudomonas citronellolis]KRV80015.1 amidohydrolase [Pseudomonas citronellolis]KRW75263.1 amidohydrolase [Pseudomonas citronellolis]
MKILIPALVSMACAFSSAESMAAADLILHGGKVYTAEPGQGLQQAVAIENGKVLAVGSDEQVLRLKAAGTRVVDLQGKVLMPGFIDSHSHTVKGGLQMLQANLDGELLPVPELEKKLREWRDNGKAKRGEFLSVGGLPSTYWGDIPALEKTFNQGEWAQVPILFVGWDLHTGWANQAMLKLAKVDAAKVATLKGEEKATLGVHADGTPNGFLVDAGLYPLQALLPLPSTEELTRGAYAALRYYNSLGITAWMDPLANEIPGADITNASTGVLPIYKALAEKGDLSAHVAALLMADSKATPKDLDELDKVRQQFLGVPNLTLPGIKIFADGVAEVPAQSAAMLEPYKNSHKFGELLIDPKHFGELVSAADARGWLVHVHAIGDRAIHESLNGMAQARRDRHSGIPHSITHLQMVNPKDFDRFRQLDVIASMQLYWASADESSIDLVKPYVDAMVFMYTYPAHSLLKHGATLAGASDWPITTPDPWKAIYQAVTRKGPKGVLNADEAIDRQVMFQAYTLNAARMIRLEDSTGSLKPGKQADMVVLDRDVFTAEPEALRDTQVLTTWFAGREVYSRPLTAQR